VSCVASEVTWSSSLYSYKKATFSRISAHRWWCGCQPWAPAALSFGGVGLNPH
jgi:hypothetical protein